MNTGGGYGAAKGLMGGGGGGGMGGLMGGLMGGGGSVSNPNLAAMGRWGGFNPASYGIGGAAPIDVNRMTPAQMAAFEQAQRYGSSNVPAGSTWE
jgi:hypothetical protein